MFREAGLRSPPFIVSLGKEVSARDIWSALKTNLIFRRSLFHVQYMVATVPFYFINRYMYFCVVAFLNDTITVIFMFTIKLLIFTDFY